jgi:APA family basic amino acid/polyamine antiporter
LSKSKVPLFAREATGLVRRLGLLDQFIVSMAIINITGGFVLTMIAAPFFFPGANMIEVFALGAIPSMAFVVTYSILSAAIPRAGGDYVWTGRILSQRLASVMAVTILFGAIFAGPAFNAWYFVAFGLAQLFFSLGVVTGNPGLVSLGAAVSQPPLGYAISLLFILAIIIIGLFGIESYRKINKYAFAIFVVTMLVFLFGLLSVNTKTFVSSFDSSMANYNVTYAQVQGAVNTNPQLATFSVWNTLLAAIPFGFLTYSGFNFNTYLVGETKQVSKTIPRALFFAVMITLVSLVILTAITYSTLGGAFVGGISYLFNTGALSSLPVQPTVNLLISLATPSWLGFLINLNVSLGFFLVALSYFMTFSRVLFAMAFDRILPEKIASVNDKYHSPHLAVVIIGVFTTIFATMIWFAGWAAAYLNTSLANPIAYIIPGLAALLFPIVKKDLYKSTVKNLPGWLSAEIAGVPVVSLGGLAVVLIWGFAVYSLLFPVTAYQYLGASAPLAIGLTIVLVVFGLVLFEVSRLYHKKKDGIDIILASKEIPPE